MLLSNYLVYFCSNTSVNAFFSVPSVSPVLCPYLLNENFSRYNHPFQLNSVSDAFILIKNKRPYS